MENQLPIYSIRGVIYTRSHSQFNYGETGTVSTPVPEEPPYALQNNQLVNFSSDSGISAMVLMGDVWFDAMAYSQGLSA